MAEKLLITREELLKYTSIGGQTDMDKIVASMIVAEQITIQEQLGTQLYNKLKQLINDDTINDPGNEKYKFLMDNFVIQMMAHYTAAALYLVLRYQVNNSGIQIPTSADSLVPDASEVSTLSQNESDRGSFYIQRFIDYMCFNSAQYPEWTSNTNDDLSPSYGKNRTPFYLG